MSHPQQEPGERARLIAEFREVIAWIGGVSLSRYGPSNSQEARRGALSTLREVLAALTPPPSHREEQEADPRMDTQCEPVTSRTAPTNEAIRLMPVVLTGPHASEFFGPSIELLPQWLDELAARMKKHGDVEALFMQHITGLSNRARMIRLLLQSPVVSAIPSSDAQPVGGRMENRELDWLHVACDDIIASEGAVSHRWLVEFAKRLKSSSPDQEGIETLIAELGRMCETSGREMRQAQAGGRLLDARQRKGELCTLNVVIEKLAALLPPVRPEGK